MLPNVRVIAFTISEIIRQKQPGGGRAKIPPPKHTHTYTQISVKYLLIDVKKVVKIINVVDILTIKS